MATTRDLQIAVLKSTDLEDWKNHIAWDEVIAPALARTRELLTRQLVEISLGKPIPGVTLEQVAGKIFGMDWFLGELDRIARGGESARTALTPPL
jgi:hypothetical protein